MASPLLVGTLLGTLLGRLKLVSRRGIGGCVGLRSGSSDEGCGEVPELSGDGDIVGVVLEPSTVGVERARDDDAAPPS